MGNPSELDVASTLDGKALAVLLARYQTNEKNKHITLKRGHSGIAPSRAFGDPNHPGVFAVPDTYVWARAESAYLCVCSDSFAEGIMPGGGIGPMQSASDMFSELLRSIRTGTTLQIATEMAVNRRVSLFRSYGDNTTLILAQL